MARKTKKPMTKKYKNYCRDKTNSSCEKSSVCILTKKTAKRRSYCRKGKGSNAKFKLPLKDMTRSQRSEYGYWLGKEQETA